jgi:hypothetical protein
MKGIPAIRILMMDKLLRFNIFKLAVGDTVKYEAHAQFYFENADCVF